MLIVGWVGTLHGYRCTLNVQAFYEAYLALDTKRVAQFLDDDIDWFIPPCRCMAWAMAGPKGNSWRPP